MRNLLFITLLICSAISVDAQINLSSRQYFSCKDSVKLDVSLFSNLTTNLQSDDIFTPAIDLGFSFPFGGTTYTQCVVSANGYISFDLFRASLYSTFEKNYLPPSSNSIFFAFHDIIPSSATINNIRVQTLGAVGDRKFVVEFCGIALFGMPSNTFTGQLVLHERNGLIDIHIGNKMNENWNNNSFIGLQIGTNWNIHPTYNTSVPQWTLSNTSFRYTPSGNTHTLSTIPYAPEKVLSSINVNDVKWYAANNMTTPIATGLRLATPTNTNIPYYVVKFQGVANTCSGTFNYDFSDTAFLQIRLVDTLKLKDTFCVNSLPYVYRNVSLNSTGSHRIYERMLTSFGCDSIIEYQVFLNMALDTLLTTQICQQSLPYTWNGLTINSVGTHTLIDTTASVISGCDSITTNIVTVRPTLRDTMTTIICQEDLPYSWNNQIVNTVGVITLTDRRPSLVSGCDSFTTNIVTVHPTLRQSQTMVICEQNLPYYWNNKSVQTVGNHTLVDTSVSLITGCDSFTTLSITVNPTKTNSISRVICQQDLPFSWNGLTVNTIGTHILVDTSASLLTNCDSITTLNLSVIATPLVTLRDTVCQSALPYTWNGLTINSVGTHTLVDTTASLISSCDSITTLYLVVNANSTLNLGNDTSICANVSYQLNGTIANPSSYLWNTNATTPTIAITTPGTYFLTATNTDGCLSRDTIIISHYAIPVVDLGADLTACMDTGWILTLDAANFGSTYVWDNNTASQTRTINQNGKYFVTVTNLNGCVNADTITAKIRINPIVNLIADTNICDGDSIVIDATTPDVVSYIWSPSVNNTPLEIVKETGLYKVTIVASNACIGSDSTFITKHERPFVDLGTDLNLCINEEELVYINAANAGAAYLWDNNYNGQVRTIDVSGKYWVVVTNTNNCSSSDSINIVLKPNPIVNLGMDTVVCKGSKVFLDAGNDGISYFWNTGATTKTIVSNLEGKHIVTVTAANGCVVQDEILVDHVGEFPRYDALRVRNINSHTFNFSFVNPTNVDAAEWNFGDGSPTVFSTSPNHTFPALGNYIVTVNTSSSCGAVADTTTVHIINSGTSIYDGDREQNLINVYPVPVHGYAQITTENINRMVKVIVVNTFGQIVSESEFTPRTSYQIDMSSYSAATYYIKVIMQDGSMATKKVVKKD